MAHAVALPLPAAAARGASFGALYAACAADVHAYVVTIVRDRDAAEDVVAATFERALRRRGSFDARRGTPRAWLFGIARNAALDELRRRRRTATLHADPPETAPGEEDDSAERATVRAALAALEPRDREIVALKFHGGLSNGELARVLGCSESNAGTRLHRALTRLREACRADA